MYAHRVSEFRKEQELYKSRNVCSECLDAEEECVDCSVMSDEDKQN